MRLYTKRNSSVTDLVFTALFAALTAVCAVISVPMPMTTVPVSLLMLGVLITGGLLPKKHAFSAQLIYLLLGAVGVPVFSGFTGGVGHLLGPTGGYLLACPVAAFLTAWIVEPFRKKKRSVRLVMLTLGMTAALMVCYLLGTVWFCIFGGYTFLRGLTLCVVPFLVPDVIKLTTAVIVTAALNPVLDKVSRH